MGNLYKNLSKMFKKMKISKYTVDYISAIIVIAVQLLIYHFENDYTRFMFDFIENTFGFVRFAPIIFALVSAFTYSIYFGNYKLSFIVGFLSPMIPQIYFVSQNFSDNITFIMEFPQSTIFSIILGVITGLIGMLFSKIKNNYDIITRVSLQAVFLISFVIHTLFGRNLDFGFWLSFNIALILGLTLSYYILYDVKKALLFTFTSLIIIYLIITKSPLDAVFSYYGWLGEFCFGIIIAIMLGISLKIYIYSRLHAGARS